MCGYRPALAWTTTVPTPAGRYPCGEAATYSAKALPCVFIASSAFWTCCCVSGLGEEKRDAQCIGDLIRLDAEQCGRSAIGSDEAGFEVFVDVCNGCFFVEIAITLLALR